MAIASTFWIAGFAQSARTGGILDPSGFILSWTSLNNLQQDDTNYSSVNATFSNGGPGSGEGLLPLLAGTALSNTTLIPNDASINGLIVRINRRASQYPSIPDWNGSTGIAITDDVIRLYNNGIPIGDNKADRVNRWSHTSFRYDTYGSETDTWNVSGGLTPSIVNSAGFGLSIGPFALFAAIPTFPGSPPGTPPFGYSNVTQIDNVELTVFYSTPGGTQFIYPDHIITRENLGQHKLIRTIHHRSITDRESLGSHKLIRTINPRSIRSSENVPAQNVVRVIRPRSIASQEQLTPSNSLRTSANINPRPIKSEELITRNIKFFNRFYDTLDPYNVWDEQSDPGDFTWDDTYRWNITPNSKSLRRIGSPSRTNKFSTSSYKFIFYTSDTLYFSGYIYLANSPNYGGLGFCIQDDLNAGYYAVIDTRNGSGGSSTHSFRLIKVTRSGGTNTFTNLASYNLSDLVSEDQWYRIIIEVSVSGNITAKLYKDRGSTLISAATLTATDTTFTQGYYGLTAFSEAGFDNLTNITAQFIETAYGIATREVFQRQQLNPGTATINLINRSISTQERIQSPGLLRFIIQNPTNKEIAFSTHTLSPGNVNINPLGIKSEEKIFERSHSLTYIDLIYNVNVGFIGSTPSPSLNPGKVDIFQNPLFKLGYFNTPNLVSVISPRSIIDETILSFNKLISNIYPRIVRRDTAVGNHSLIRNINPRIFRSLEQVSSHSLIQNIKTITFNKLNSFSSGLRLNASNKIEPYILFKSFSENLHRLNTSIYKLEPSSIQSIENLSLHKILRVIQPNILNLQEAVGIHNLVPIIKPINIFKNSNSFGMHNLLGANIISPRTVSSVNSFSIHQLVKNTYSIQPKTFDSYEKLGNHSLVGIIQPYSIVDFSNQYLNNHTVKANYNIISKSINEFSSYGNHELFPLVAVIRPNLVHRSHVMGQFLTVKSGEVVIYQNTQFPLLGNYQPPMTEGPIGQHEVISINNILPDPISSKEKLSLHNLIATAYIYPYPIYDYDGLLPKMRLVLPGNVPPSLKPKPGPGEIQSWTYLPHTIESHLKFRKTS